VSFEWDVAAWEVIRHLSNQVDVGSCTAFNRFVEPSSGQAEAPELREPN